MAIRATERSLAPHLTMVELPTMHLFFQAKSFESPNPWHPTVFSTSSSRISLDMNPGPQLNFLKGPMWQRFLEWSTNFTHLLLCFYPQSSFRALETKAQLLHFDFFFLFLFLSFFFFFGGAISSEAHPTISPVAPPSPFVAA